MRNLVLTAGVCALVSGCLAVRYVGQATYGQMRLWQKSRGIDAVLADPTTSARERRLLGEVTHIKAFAAQNALTASKSYKSYVRLPGPAVVWVLNAARPLSFETMDWSFPIAGNFPYLGWFERDEAREYQQRLEREGWEVNVRAASAYSTLGWFSDPVLSSMFTEGDEAMGEFVNVVLHESVHATIHISGQAFFNESIAMYVADTLTPDYLRERFGEGSLEYQAYIAAKTDGDQRKARLLSTYAELDKLYKSALSDVQKLAKKRALLEGIRHELDLDITPNNAYLVGYRTYGVGQPEFAALFAACGRNWTRFQKAVATVDGKSFKEEQQEDIVPVLTRLTARRCPQ